MIATVGKELVEDTANTLEDILGERLISLFLFGSLSEDLYEANISDINLLVVADSTEDINIYRQLLRPVWRTQGEFLRSAPMICTPENLNRHLALNPLFENHLVRNGRLILGEDILWQNVSDAEQDETAALARDSMTLSTLLTPSLLTEQEKSTASQFLRRVHKHLFGLPLTHDSNETEQLFRVLIYTNSILLDYPEILLPEFVAMEAPPLVHRLLSVYEADNCLYLVLPNFSSEEFEDVLYSVEWPAIAERIAGHYRQMRLITAGQLRMILSYDMAADYRLTTFNRVWGADVIEQLPIEEWRVFRQLARMPSDLILVNILDDYISTLQSDLAMLVHDYQNQLLNIQLRNELLCRIMGYEIETSPEPLPAREAPIEVRIQGIFNHLEWWASYYANKMEAALPA
jgi:hypothetical protein